MDKNIVEIDENNLDKECIRLPSSYLQAAHACADAKNAVDEFKRQLDVAEADVSKRVRDMPGTFGLEKVTESAVRECVTRSKEYNDALKAYNLAKHEAEMSQALVWALEHKKRSLTLLVDLHGMGYFSSPLVSEKGKAAVQQDIRGARRRNRED